MIGSIWHDSLFSPLLNLLIYFYNNIAFGNLGIAVVYMTIALRLVLIPLSIIAERNRFKFEKIQEDVDAIQEEFKEDAVARKEHLRGLLKANKIRPWASGILLIVQFLALVLLYQVFIGGMTGKLTDLYSSVQRPDIINTRFLGFDIAEKNVYVAGIVGLLVYVQTWYSQRKRKGKIKKADLLFRLMFPLSIFIVLAILPSVKAVFIMTAILFSYLVRLFRPFFTRSINQVKHTAIKIHDKIVSIPDEKVNQK